MPNVNDFAFERIPAFIKSSRDEVPVPPSFVTYHSNNRLGPLGSGKTGAANIFRFNLFTDRNPQSTIFLDFRRPSSGCLDPESTFPTRGGWHFDIRTFFHHNILHLIANELYPWTANAIFNRDEIQRRGIRD